jgi:CHAT domain-containing protein
LFGLAFANANRSNAAPLDEEDGLLIADEVASLDLQCVEWAVLSGCDTGVGEIRDGEGVLGLRRAFQVAGARSVIMSLWEVSDRATCQWMEGLYAARFAGGLHTADAVSRATREVLEARRRHGQSTHPFYWGAFVAAGDWR